MQYQTPFITLSFPNQNAKGVIDTKCLKKVLVLSVKKKKLFLFDVKTQISAPMWHIH